MILVLSSMPLLRADIFQHDNQADKGAEIRVVQATRGAQAVDAAGISAEQQEALDEITRAVVDPAEPKKEGAIDENQNSGGTMKAAAVGGVTGLMLALGLTLPKRFEALDSSFAYVFLAGALTLSAHDIVKKRIGKEYGSVATWTALSTLIGTGFLIAMRE